MVDHRAGLGQQVVEDGVDSRAVGLRREFKRAREDPPAKVARASLPGFDEPVAPAVDDGGRVIAGQ